jgi:hypothetical protein
MAWQPQRVYPFEDREEVPTADVEGHR